MTIRAVLVDADGVVIAPTWRFAAYLERAHGLPREHTHTFFHGLFQACLRDQADLLAALPPYLAAWGWPHTLEAFVETGSRRRTTSTRP